MCWMHLRIRLGLLSAREYCWSIVNMLVIRTIASCCVGPLIPSPASQSVLTAGTAMSQVQNMPLALVKLPIFGNCSAL